MLSGLVQDSRTALFVLDPSDGRVVDCNRGAVEHLGYSREELLGLSVVDFEATLDDYGGFLEQIRELRYREILKIHGEHVRENGERVTVRVRAERIEYDENEFILARVEPSSDISTDSIAINQKFKHYSRLFQEAPIGLVEVDGTHLFRNMEQRREEGISDFYQYLDEDVERILDFFDRIDFGEINDRTLEIVGANSRQQLVENFPSLIPPESYEFFKEAFTKFAQRVPKISDTLKIRTFEGEERWVELIMETMESAETYYKEIFISLIDVTDRKQAQIQLEEQEKSFRNLVKNVPEVVYRCLPDSEWTMQYISQDIEEITGFPASDFLENEVRSYESVIHPEDREDVRDTISQALIEGETFETEYRIDRADGEVRWVLERGRGLRNEEGEEYIEGIILDVTQRRETQERLRENEERYRKLFENSRVGMAEISFDENWLHTNDQLQEMLGYTQDEFLDMKCRDITHPDSIGQNQEFARKLKEREVDHFTSEKRYRHKEGHWIWVRMTVSRVDIPRNGYDGYFVAIIENIHERYETERKLSESERRFRSLFENAAVGIAHVDLDGTFLRANDELVNLLGYTREELEGTKFQDVTHPEDLDKDLEHLDQLKSGQSQQYSMEKRYIRQDGSSFWAELTVGVVLDDEETPDYFVSVIQDISERKRTEKELRRSESRFRTTFQDAGVGMAHIFKDGRISRVNQRLVDFLGYSSQELTNRNVLDLIHPDDTETIREALNCLWAGEIDHYSGEQRYLRKDGTVVWGKIGLGIPRLDEMDDPPYSIAALQDINRRKRLQDRHQTFFELSPDLMAIADYEGRLIQVNSAFESTLGYSREEITSQPFMEFVHPEDREETWEKLEQLRKGQPVESHENRYETSDGDWRWLNWRATPGDEYIYTVARDVTRRHEYEQQLESMLDEKETLLKEVHHRVKNNLQVICSLLDMAKRRHDNEKTMEVLESCTERVQSMALIHEQLYQSDQLSSVNFRKYLDDLLGRLCRVRGVDRKHVDLDLDLRKDRMPLDLAIPCGIILNELLANALEYGFSADNRESIHVKLGYTNEDDLRLKVRDSGPGFPEDFDIDKSNTLGLEVVRTLTNYELGGSLQIRNDGGASVTVTFPLDEHRILNED